MMSNQGEGTTNVNNHIPGELYNTGAHFSLSMFINMASAFAGRPYETLAGITTTGLPSDPQLVQHLETASRHRELFHNLTQVFSSLYNGASDAELALRAVASEAEMVVNSADIPTQLQPPDAQAQDYDDSDTATTLPAEYFYGSSNTDTLDLWPEQHEPLQSESSRTPNNHHHFAATISTRSSHTDMHTSSSAQPWSSTNPSSAYGQTDEVLLSPSTSLHHYRRWSGNSDVSECVILPRMLPQHTALPRTYPPSEDPRFADSERPEHIDSRVLEQSDNRWDQ